jgi:hypothetical protein
MDTCHPSSATEIFWLALAKLFRSPLRFFCQQGKKVASTSSSSAWRPLLGDDRTSCCRARSGSDRGEPLAPHLPCLLAHPYSRLACPWSQDLDRRDGQHQVNLLLGLRRLAEPPEAAAAAPRRPVQQEATRGRCSRAEALTAERARVAAHAGVRASAEACGHWLRRGYKSGQFGTRAWALF